MYSNEILVLSIVDNKLIFKKKSIRDLSFIYHIKIVDYIFYVYDYNIIICLDIYNFNYCPRFEIYKTFTRKLSDNIRYQKSTNTLIIIEFNSYAKYIVMDASSGLIISYYEHELEPIRNFYSDDDTMNLYTEQRSASHFNVINPLQ